MLENDNELYEYLINSELDLENLRLLIKKTAIEETVNYLYNECSVDTLIEEVLINTSPPQEEIVCESVTRYSDNLNEHQIANLIIYHSHNLSISDIERIIRNETTYKYFSMSNDPDFKQFLTNFFKIFNSLDSKSIPASIAKRVEYMLLSPIIFRSMEPHDVNIVQVKIHSILSSSVRFDIPSLSVEELRLLVLSPNSDKIPLVNRISIIQNDNIFEAFSINDSQSKLFIANLFKMFNSIPNGDIPKETAEKVGRLLVDRSIRHYIDFSMMESLNITQLKLDRIIPSQSHLYQFNSILNVDELRSIIINNPFKLSSRDKISIIQNDNIIGAFSINDSQSKLFIANFFKMFNSIPNGDIPKETADKVGRLLLNPDIRSYIGSNLTALQAKLQEIVPSQSHLYQFNSILNVDELRSIIINNSNKLSSSDKISIIQNDNIFRAFDIADNQSKLFIVNFFKMFNSIPNGDIPKETADKVGRLLVEYRKIRGYISSDLHTIQAKLLSINPDDLNISQIPGSQITINVDILKNLGLGMLVVGVIWIVLGRSKYAITFYHYRFLINRLTKELKGNTYFKSNTYDKMIHYKTEFLECVDAVRFKLAFYMVFDQNESLRIKSCLIKYISVSFLYLSRVYRDYLKDLGVFVPNNINKPHELFSIRDVRISNKIRTDLLLLNQMKDTYFDEDSTNKVDLLFRTVLSPNFDIERFNFKSIK